MPEPFIKTSSLVKTYDTPVGPLKVLRGIDLELRKGSFVALVGPSGVGKTTFLNMLTGIDKPTSGTVFVGGMDVTNDSESKLTRWRGRNIGIVFQFSQLLPTLTVLENVVMPMDFCNVHKREERRDRAMALLRRFDILDQAHKTPDLLSGGQQQRVSIARALANDPPLLIGDEPTSNLDHLSAAVVFDTFHELQAQGHTIVIVTHDRDLVRDVPTVLALRNGLVEAAPLDAATQRRSSEQEALRVIDL
jgi:putative ABC transport system ATP-binding protein